MNDMNDVKKRHDKIGRRLKELSKGRYTVSDLAQKLHLGEKTVRNYRNGTYPFDYDTLFDLAALFECDADYILGLIDQETRDLADVNKITGLSTEAINNLHPAKRAPFVWNEGDDRKSFDPLSWYLSHGLVEIIDDTSSTIQEIYNTIQYVSSLPDELKRIFDFIQRAKVKGSIVYGSYILELLSLDDSQLEKIQMFLQNNVIIQQFGIVGDSLFNRICNSDTDTGEKIRHYPSDTTGDKELVKCIFRETVTLLDEYCISKDKEELLLFNYQNKCLDLLKQYRKETEPVQKKVYDDLNNGYQEYVKSTQFKEGDDK